MGRLLAWMILVPFLTPGALFSQDPDRPVLSAARKFFSPNSDGRRDTIVVQISGGPQDLADWTIDIYDAAGRLVRSVRADQRRMRRGLFTGPDDEPEIVAPSAIEWNGRDSDGKFVPDGVYTLMARWIPRLGEIAESRPLRIFVDTDRPQAEITPVRSCVVRKTPLEEIEGFLFDQKVTGMRGGFARGVLRSAAGEEVDERTWSDEVTRPVKWNGKMRNGDPAPPGVYSYSLTVEDAAGNETTAVFQHLLLSDTVCQIDIRPDSPNFSPDGNGDADKVVFNPVFFVNGEAALPRERPQVRGWSLEIFSADMKLKVRSFGTTAAAPESLDWDGRDNVGRMMPDGQYFAVFTASTAAGQQKTRPRPVWIDRRAPSLSVTPSSSEFAPDGDGEEDLLIFRTAADDASRIRSWEFQVSLVLTGDEQKRLFRRWAGTGGPPAGITWDGMSDGILVADSVETFEWALVVTDGAGNTRSIRGRVKTDILFQSTQSNGSVLVSRIPNRLHFDARNKLTDEGRDVLRRVRRALEKYRRYTAYLEIHSAIPGVEEANLQKTEERSWEAFVYLRSQKPAVRSLHYRGLGETEPITPSMDSFASYKNERIELRLELESANQP